MKDKTKKRKQKKDRVVDEEVVIGRSALTKKKKKRAETDDGTEPSKKKKRTPDMAKAKLERRQGKLNAALEEIDIEAVKRNVNPGERDYLEEYVWMFNRVGRLIRAVEKQALKSGQSRDIYALSTLISQQREIIADIRTLADMSGQIAMIRDGIIQPAISGIGQNLLDTYYQLRRLITETSLPKETQFALRKLEEITKEQSKFLQLKYHEAADRLDRVMAGEDLTVSESAPKKKKKKSKSN